ncbi:MAG TPA: isoaspartyl peptidase/L-asparaginase [Nevskiaceae bacterium]|nr:isoaspartyl peptidase/L-asparaginase [Nevskiaceae bacterium]
MAGTASDAPIRLALHGGAGELPREAGPPTAQRAALREIAAETLAALRAGASALDAVTLAVERLEDCPLFNAGVGAVLHRDGGVELDAAVMRGADRAYGGVCGVSRVRHPVRLARRLCEAGGPVLVQGAGAEALAREHGLELVSPAHFITPLRQAQLERAQRRGVVVLDHDLAPPAEPVDESGFGTVGAVARDAQGRLAAATSTGGLTNKRPGRIGDTPIAGAGTWADDRSLAVSCTGTGESFLRAAVAHQLHARVLWGGQSLALACEATFEDVAALGGHGGAIVIDREGRIALPYNSGVLFRAWVEADGEIRVAVGKD